MTEPSRTGWLLPVLLAVSTSAALGLGYLHLARPNPGELGSVRVVVSDDDGKGGVVRLVVAGAPLAQKAVVTPGAVFLGIVHYPVPYRVPPNLKLTCGKRQYTVTAETEFGFSWIAEPLDGDFREGRKKDISTLEKVLGLTLTTAAASGALKPGLIFEEFTWEAKGIPAPMSALPPRTFEQKGRFQTYPKQEGVVHFPIPYASPANVVLSGTAAPVVVITEGTAKGFKWRNAGMYSDTHGGEMTWTAKGVLGPAEGK